MLAPRARFAFAAEGAVWGVLDNHPGETPGWGVLADGRPGETPGCRHPRVYGSREWESSICGRQGRRLRKEILRIWI